jgi:hypothetical protein
LLQLFCFWRSRGHSTAAESGSGDREKNHLIFTHNAEGNLHLGQPPAAPFPSRAEKGEKARPRGRIPLGNPSGLVRQTARFLALVYSRPRHCGHSPKGSAASAPLPLRWQLTKAKAGSFPLSKKTATAAKRKLLQLFFLFSENL